MTDLDAEHFSEISKQRYPEVLLAEVDRVLAQVDKAAANGETMILFTPEFHMKDDIIKMLKARGFAVGKVYNAEGVNTGRVRVQWGDR